MYDSNFTKTDAMRRLSKSYILEVFTEISPAHIDKAVLIKALDFSSIGEQVQGCWDERLEVLVLWQKIWKEGDSATAMEELVADKYFDILAKLLALCTISVLNEVVNSVGDCSTICQQTIDLGY